MSDQDTDRDHDPDPATHDGAEADSLAAWMVDGDAPGGVEADEVLARLRRGMFEVSEASVHIGKYRDLSAVGRGGMGVVYQAHDEALDRAVAIKLLRADTKSQEPRLRREARAMARLSHPHVVQVLEVGEHEGETYIVMELVQGQDAGSWLAAAPRCVAQVLEVYLGAGRGLAAAHEQGLVHRDFKPGNVMVGDDGRARVTDFGLAAAMEGAEETGDAACAASGPRGRLGSEATATGARVGTPRYMAPEQLAGARVDHRADQWAFAVSLWEALYGQHPRLASTRAHAVGRVPAAIGRVLRRALLEDPLARHASMDVLLGRLEAAASGRGRRRVIAAAVGFLTVSGAAGGLWLALPGSPEPRCEPDPSVAALWSPARRASVARAFAATALPFQAEAWSVVEGRIDPWIAQWSAEYRRACEGTAASTEEDTGGADARMQCLRGGLAQVDALLEVFADADADVVAQAERATRELPDPSQCASSGPVDTGLSSPELQAHAERLARVRALAGTGRYAEAARIAQADLDALDALGTEVGPRARAEAQLELGANHTRAGALQEAPDPLRAAFYAAAELEDAALASRATLSLLINAIRRSELEQGEQWARHADTWIARVADEPERIALERELAVSRAELLAELGRNAEAMAELERAWALCNADESHPLAPRLFNMMGLVQLALGEYDKAAAVLERAIRLEVARSGRAHPQVANGLNNLGSAHWFKGDYDTAERYYQETYEIRRDSLGPDNAKTAVSVMNLGLIASARGDEALALQRFTQAQTDLARILGPEHPQTVQAMDNAAASLSATGEWERSNTMHRRALDLYVARLGPDHPTVADTLSNLASGLTMTGHYHEALDLHARALVIIEKARGREHPHYAMGLHNMAVIHRRLEQFDVAEQLDRAALATDEAALGPDHPELGQMLTGLAQNAVAQGRWQDAIDAAERALAVEPADTTMRGTAGLWLAQARWEARRDRAGVSQVVEQAERDLRASGRAGEENLGALLRWRDAHPL